MTSRQINIESEYFDTPKKDDSQLSQEIVGAFGLQLHDSCLDGIANTLVTRMRSEKKTRVAFVNAHCVNQMCRNDDYNHAVRSADYVLPDGSGIAIANVMFSGKSCRNLNGTDLAPVLFQKAAKNGLSVYFFGGLPGVAKNMCNKLQRRFPGLQIAGYRQGYFHPTQEKRVIEEINDAKPDMILVAMGVPRQDVWLARHADELNAKMVMGVGGLFDFLSERLPRAPRLLRALGSEWVYRLLQEPQRMWKRYILGNPEFLGRAVIHANERMRKRIAQKSDDCVRRCIDILGASVGLAVLSPVFLATAIAIRLESPGSVLFRQTRVGKGGVEFSLLKFRSMRVDAESVRWASYAENHHGNGSVTFKMRRDPRVTKVGSFIRKYSIDELPQFWNIICGQMSIVGPRPALPSEVREYTERQSARLKVKPGLTCTWQISGRADIGFEEQANMDIAYIKGRSIWRDLSIMLKTPFAVITAKGAY